MTLDEAIKKENNLGDSCYELANSYHTDEGVYLQQEMQYREKSEEHWQLAEWLMELKTYKEGIEKIKEQINNYKGNDMYDEANAMEFALELLGVGNG